MIPQAEALYAQLKRVHYIPQPDFGRTYASAGQRIAQLTEEKSVLVIVNIKAAAWSVFQAATEALQARGHALIFSDNAPDAAPDAEAHRRILNGRTADAAFWNSQYLSYPETRALLRGCAGVSYIYHMPVDDADVSGIRRKCERNMQRFGAELPNVRVLTHYPSILDI